MVNYDYHTGQATETKTIESDFLNFMDKVEKVKDMTPVVVHTMKYANAVKNTFSNNNNQNSGNNGFIPQSQNTGSPVNYNPAPSTNANSMDEFLPFV